KLSAGKLSESIPGKFGGAAASAIIGGTASTLSGGKFANGALSGAFGYLFNQCGSGCELTRRIEEEYTIDDYGCIHGGSLTVCVGPGAIRQVGSKLLFATKKGLTTPNKYFGSKTYKEAEKALTDKFGPPRGGGKFNKSFFNEKTGRTYNLHKDPSHRGGKGHIDIRKRDLPSNYYKDRPFYLKEGG
ncbi:hypothetical protein, partial [Thiolapillus sp.]